MHIQTERLVLRAWRPDDFEDFARISADPEVMRYVANGQPATRAQSWRAMAMFVGHWSLRGYGLWAAEERATGEFVGRIGLSNPEGWPGLEVGWLLDRGCWERGLATEGARAALAYAFTTLGADHVISVIHPRNSRSIRVAEKIGERFEREIDFDGNPTLIYGVTR
ncbi:MAG: GNAT family N-acetyltransferase [Actinomycetota bacterium]|nr:GNAT family N-acetyltransferase [Actinomycetota bacterium]